MASKKVSVSGTTSSKGPNSSIKHQQQQRQGTPSHGFSSLVQSEIENTDSCSRNPLHCLICNNVFEDPRILSCYHSFCAKCLDGRIGETKINCPLCGKVSGYKEGVGPSPDFLLRYLLDSSSEIIPSCANCDNKGRVPMYYCNTCGQVLCNGCREETHRAKMFSAHDIIPVSRYTKENPKKCSIHGEHYIMFSTIDKSMLCINCYRDTPMEARLHCVDLDTAYNQGAKKLDRAVLSLRDLQIAVRDGITMLKNVLEELRRNSDSEKSAVNAVCQTILDALNKTQQNLTRDVENQSEIKDKVIRGQLCQLRAVLPTIKLHLTMCASISNASSKYDFLDLAYPLIERLTAITHMGYPIRPGQSSQIKSSYKSEIARTLEPWVSGVPLPPYPPPPPPPQSSSNQTMIPIVLTSVDPNTFTEPTYSQYYPMSRSTVTPASVQQQQQPPPAPPPPPLPNKPRATDTAQYAHPNISSSSGRKTPTSKSTKANLDGVEEQFATHCRSFSNFFNELNQRLVRLKEQVQDLHRDVTLQRGGSYISRTESALHEGLILEEQLNRRQMEMERIKKLLESSWNEHIRIVKIEQEVIQNQMKDLLSLKAEVKQLSTILQQLQSFLKTIGVHQLQGQHPGGSGGGGGGGGAGTGSGGHGQDSSRQLQHHHHHQQQQQQSDSSKSYHVHAPDQQPGVSRMESGSQVTPSLNDLSFTTKGPPIRGKKDSISQKSSELVSRLGRFSISKVSSGGVGGGGHGQGGSSSGSSIQAGSSKLGETEYIQVDTSYPHHQIQATHPHPHPHHQPSLSRRGILNQIIDKVHRKKSSSGSSTTGIPSSTANAMSIAAAQSALAASNRAAARAAMYDAQVQYGNYPNDRSAVTALRRGSARFNRGRGGGSISSTGGIRPTNGKGFVKSKSDDERPPSKLNRESRARSVAAMDPESLLRSISSSKEASRILSLYKSLLEEREQQQHHHSGGGSTRCKQSHQQQQQQHQLPRRSSSNKYKRNELQYPIDDDYQQISSFREPLPPLPRRPSSIIQPSPQQQQQQQSTSAQSSSIRPTSYYPGTGSLGKNTPSKTHVQVFVHQEPSSVPTPILSKSLEEQYLFGFISDSELTLPPKRPLKKTISVESLISLSSAGGGGGGNNENSRKSSIDFDRRSVCTVRRVESLTKDPGGSLPLPPPRQQSWETGLSLSPLPSPNVNKPPSSVSTPILSPDPDILEDEFGRSSSSSGRRGPFYDDEMQVLHKADSFEGHEEAVRSLVQAVQETRTLQRKMQSN